MSPTLQIGYSAAENGPEMPRSSKPKKLPKSLIEFWAKPQETAASTKPAEQSVCSSIGQYRMVHGNKANKHAANDTSIVSQSSEKSQSTEKSQRSPLVRQRLFDSRTSGSSSVSSNDTPSVRQDVPLHDSADDDDLLQNSSAAADSVISQHEAAVAEEKQTFSEPPSNQSAHGIDDDPFAIPNHSSHETTLSVTDVADDSKSSFDSQRHASWVWDGETQELHHVADQSAYSSTDGKILEVLGTMHSQNGAQAQEAVDQDDGDEGVNGSGQFSDSFERQASRSAATPKDAVANVVSAATAALLNDSAHFSEISNCSFPSTMFHSTHESLSPDEDDDDDDGETELQPEVEYSPEIEDQGDCDEEPDTIDRVQSSAPADLNQSDDIMANIVNAANAAIQGKDDFPKNGSTPTQSRTLHTHFDETPLRSNRHEDGSEADRRTSPQKPPRSSPPSRRIMNASPQPPSSPIAFRRTLSKGDSKPSPKRDDIEFSVHDDSTSASSHYRNDEPGDNFERLFAALFDFVNPPDDQSEVSFDTMSTTSKRWHRSFDHMSQQDASQAGSPKPLSVEKSSGFLDIRSWWPEPTMQSKPDISGRSRVAADPAKPSSQRSENTASEPSAQPPWLETIQSSLFSKRPSGAGNKANGWEPKSYLDATSFDALEEIAEALQRERDAAPRTGPKIPQDAIGEQFLSLFERLRAGKAKYEMDLSRNCTDDGIEVTIDDSRLNVVATKNQANTDQEVEKGFEPQALSATLASLPLQTKDSSPPQSRSFEGVQTRRILEASPCKKGSGLVRASSEPGYTATQGRADMSLSEFIEMGYGYTTPENSMLMHNDEKSLSPILAKAESPIAEKTFPLSTNSEDVDEESSAPGYMAQTSEKQASIDQQLRDLYAVVQKNRKVNHSDSRASNGSYDASAERSHQGGVFLTPSPKKEKACVNFTTNNLTPLTADETDASPASTDSPAKPLIRAHSARVRRRLPKISITTLSGNGGLGQKSVSPERDSTPNTFFECTLPDPVLPETMAFGRDPMWAMGSALSHPSRSNVRKANTSFGSESGLTHLGHELNFSQTNDSGNEPMEPPSPQRRQLLRKNRSSYSIVEDSTVNSNDKSGRPVRDFLGLKKKVKRATISNEDDPSQSEFSRGSISASSANGAQSESSAQRRNRGIKPRFTRQLSLSWLNRSNKPKCKKGSILDEESDFNNTTNESSYHSFDTEGEKEPFASPFDIPNIEEAVPYPDSAESNNGYSQDFSGETPDSSFEWSAPTKRMLRQQQTKSSWTPSLQGLNDTWEEVAEPTENIPPSPPLTRTTNLRSRPFHRHSSLRSIHRHSTSPVQRYPQKRNALHSSRQRAFFSRSSSVPNMRENFIFQPSRRMVSPSKPVKDISWVPPHQVTAKAPAEEEDSFLIPPAASWEEFNGFTPDFWQPQEI